METPPPPPESTEMGTTVQMAEVPGNLKSRALGIVNYDLNRIPDKVEDQITADKFSDFLGNIGTVEKLLEEERKKITGPLNEAKRNLDTFFRNTFTIPLGDIKAMLQARLKPFLQEQERQRNEEAERRRKEEADEALRKAAEAEALGNKRLAEREMAKAEKAESAPPPAEKARAKGDITGKGTGLRKTWKYEVEDLLEVPAKYLEVNGTLLMADFHQGQEEVPGIRFYQEETVSTR